MEGICGLFSAHSKIAHTAKTINRMAASLSDGEPLQTTVLSGGNWAISGAAWPRRDWTPAVFSFQDNRIALMATADIHNFDELATALRCSADDKGQLLALNYMADKDSWATKLRGNFSILIYDASENRMIAATDRFGLRPLYWGQSGDVCYFGSRLNAIKSAGIPLRVNRDAVYAFLHHEMIPAPMTIYKNVSKLEPGFQAMAAQGEVRLQRYWDIASQPKLTDDLDLLGGRIYDCLQDAVRLMSEGLNSSELGCYLSGGTDSSSICGLLAGLRNAPVNAYSIGFPENGYDEMNYARIAADAYGLNHHQYYVQPQDVLETLPKLTMAYDEPFGNSSIIPAYFCAREARKDGVNYMLAGDGGDEIFGGNDRYSTQQVFRNYYKVPGIIRNALLEPLLLDRMERLPIRLFHKAGSYIRRAKQTDVQRIYSYRYVTDEQVFDPAFLQSSDIESVEGIPENHFNQMQPAALLDRHLYLDMKMTISDNDIVKVTRMAQVAGIRVRYPMLDSSLVDLAFRIPVELKLRRTRQLRYIFKYAFRDVLPQEILQKKKHGFGLPVAEWLRSHPGIKSLAHDVLFSADHLQRGVIRPEFVKELWALHQQDNTPYYGTYLWKLLMLEAWHKVHLENKSL